MTGLTCNAQLRLDHLPDYMPPILDRLASFDASLESSADTHLLRYGFGVAELGVSPGRLDLRLEAPDADSLQRLRELVTVAVNIYAKSEQPQVIWQGDLAGESRLVTFRKMRVLAIRALSPRMRRVRLGGDDLRRFGAFGGMHVRVLFPTADNPEPIWPIAGTNGLPAWPSEARRPVARVYTIRSLDIDAGHMDLDFVVHGDAGHDQGVGAAWALSAREGDEVGIIGPLGRPLRGADWYVIGCDETGLPAVGRILEALPARTRGKVFVEVADRSERQDLVHPAGMTVEWIFRNGVPAGEHPALLEAVSSVAWPSDLTGFGWFAAESDPARKLRSLWRESRGLGRDRTLVSGYWTRGAAGPMAG